MPRQPIRVEKIVANLHVPVEQDRHQMTPFFFERRVQIDIDHVDNEVFDSDFLERFQGRQHAVAKVAISSRQHRQVLQCLL